MGVPGAFTATDAEGSEGSDAGVAKALAGAGVEDGAASCACLEQAVSANNNAIDRREGPEFIGGGLSKASTLLDRASPVVCSWPDASFQRAVRMPKMRR